MKNSHPSEEMLADFLDNRLSREERQRVMGHIASCDNCLKSAISAYETVKPFKRERKNMGKINIYMLLAIISFALSFAVPRFFVQLLVATLLLGAKWVVDSKSTKMLVMIHEAWKNSGERGVSETLRRFDPGIKSRH